MSTPPRRDAKAAAKRRAATRRKVRDIGRYVFAYAVIGLLLIGTISTVFVAQTPVGPIATPVPTANPQWAQLLTQADAAITTGDFTTAVSLYNAYLVQGNGSDADVLFKLGKAYVDPRNPNPDYVVGLSHLQRAVTINPNAPWAAEANQLMAQYSDKALAALTATVTGAVTGTATSGLQLSATSTTVITATTPITP